MNLFFRAATLAALLFVSSTKAHSQNSFIVQNGAPISVPAPAVASKLRLQIRNGSAVVDEENARIVNGVATATLDAEPGRYELRLTQSDKARTPVGASTNIIVPGIRREAGVWLFNGSMWIEKGENLGAAPSKTPSGLLPPPSGEFLLDLKRQQKRKPPLSVVSSMSAPLRWSTWKTHSLTDRLTPIEARKPYAGQVVAIETPAGTTELQIQRVKEEVTRNYEGYRFGASAAHVLSVETTDSLLAAQQIDAAAAQFDAVVLKFDAKTPLDEQLWPLKMARRVAEEQPNYDLPIFVDVSSAAFSEAQLLELFQSGATGFIHAPGQAKPSWMEAWERNSNWLSGAVTLEDAAILPGSSPAVLKFADLLRDSGRIPLAGRAPDEDRKIVESLFVPLDEQTSAQTIADIKRAATQGATLYLEGLPPRALYAEMGDATGTALEPLASPKIETLTLDDVWLWGTLRGRELSVEQRAKITIKGSLAARAKEKKGLAIETQPRAAASLGSDANGLLICPVGKGRILWQPHSFRADSDLAPFYSAVAGTMQTALVSVSNPNVRAAMRATPGKTPLVALFNGSEVAQTVAVTARGDAERVLNLIDERDVPFTSRGFETKFSLTIPARSFVWVALASTKLAFDKERATAKIRARLK